jgi:hypothetical protein
MSEKLLLTRLPTDAPPKSPLERETLSGSVPPLKRGARGDRTLSDTSQTSSGGITADNSPEQTELILTGLVEKREGILQIKNPIYQQIFNFDWVAQQLANLCPY